MRRIALLALVPAAIVAGFATSAGADDAHTYKIEMYNAFGIVEGSDVRVSGVNAGQVTGLDINEDKRAVVTVEVSGELAELGERTRCSAEPQSLIAEYFIDCDPAGAPMPQGGTVPASRVAQTVQPDLVQNTFREPYRERLQLLINEFGTALAGNPETLNEAIRLGAPALTETEKATRILADQNRIIRDLSVDADRVIGELARARQDVVSFVDEAEDAASASASRREDLSRDFELLDDFLAELDPTLVALESFARAQTPLLTDLRGAASGLNRLALNLPGFAAATEQSLSTLGDASLAGRKALTRGRDEVELLAEAGRKAPVTAEALADFARDIDDPRRAVEIDDRAVEDTGRTNAEPGQRDTKGYTGFESLLNWFYYVTGSTAQFDQVAHSMHINFTSFLTGPCGQVTTGRDPQTGEVGVPTNSLALTTDLTKAADCVQWLGPNQPGITEDSGLPPYPPEVCPNGTEPAAARPLCSPEGTGARRPRVETGARRGGTDTRAATPPAATPQGSGTNVPDEALEDVLDLPAGALENPQNLPQQIQEQLENLGQGLGQGLNQGLGGAGQLGGNGGGGSGGGGGGGSLLGGGATGDLLDFLFGG